MTLGTRLRTTGRGPIRAGPRRVGMARNEAPGLRSMDESGACNLPAKCGRPGRFTVYGWVLLALLVVAGAGGVGCNTRTRSPDFGPVAKLARVGLRLETPAEARLPGAVRDRCLPVRTVPGSVRPALPPHPAGYLIMRIHGRPAGASAIRAALASWQPGEILVFTIRRNPYRLDGTEWWESEVRIRLP